MKPLPFTAYHNGPTHTPEHAANLRIWDTVAASPDLRAAMSTDDCLAWLAWNDPNGEWASIREARNNPHVCTDDCRAWGCSYDPDEYAITDDEIREALTTMMEDN